MGMDTTLLTRTASTRPDAGAPPDTSVAVNDVHSRLNGTAVDRIVRPRTVTELRGVVRQAAEEGSPLSICGGRHAMGGQQFAARRTLLDMTLLDRVVEVDPRAGPGEVGVWHPMAAADRLLWAFPGERDGWGIIQKQTGADRLTIGGALAANIHGRGLTLRPFVGDVESFDAGRRRRATW